MPRYRLLWQRLSPRRWLSRFDPVFVSRPMDAFLRVNCESLVDRRLPRNPLCLTLTIAKNRDSIVKHLVSQEWIGNQGQVPQLVVRVRDGWRD